jgi:hypothetical protein
MFRHPGPAHCRAGLPALEPHAAARSASHAERADRNSHAFASPGADPRANGDAHCRGLGIANADRRADRACAAHARAHLWLSAGSAHHAALSETIQVACQDVGESWSCIVTVGEAADQTDHVVSVRPADLQRYGAGPDTDVDLLVRRSFEFLLNREPKEAILRSFDLSVIERYFPDYATEIRRT